VEEAVLVGALGIGFSLLGVVLLLVKLGFSASFLAVTGRLKILGSFHAFAEVNDFGECLGNRIKVLLVHLANPVARDSVEDNVDDLVKQQLLSIPTERLKVGEFIIVDAANIDHIFASRHVLRLATEAAHPALLLGQRLVRRQVDNDLAESFEDPVILRRRWCNSIHRCLLGTSIATGSNDRCSSGVLVNLILSVK
jgi:hypothetical protein